MAEKIDIPSYSAAIRTIIFIYLIKPGYFSRDDQDDLVNEVFLRISRRETNIISNFRGASKFSTYMNAVVYFICLELKREKIRANGRASNLAFLPVEEITRWFENIRSEELSVESRMIIREYARKLELLLQTYPKSKTKTEFTLKALCRMVLMIGHLNGLLRPGVGIDAIAKLISDLNQASVGITDQEVYFHLTSIFNQVENKQNGQDAIRKWMDDRMEELIVGLNGNPPQSCFTKESLRYLYEFLCNFRGNFLQN